MDIIFEAIRCEREKQDTKWGEQNHHPIEWTAILGEEFGEVSKAALEYHFTKNLDQKRQHLTAYKEELIQVAAVAVAMLQSLERNELSV